jgi:hypothetical protein
MAFRSLLVRSVATAAAGGFALIATVGAAGAPSVSAGYHQVPFIAGPAGTTNPDSVTSGRGHIYIGYQNNAASDGTSGGPSLIVEYTMVGAATGRHWNVAGKNDGLRYNRFDGKLWATRNEDGNPGLTIIDLGSGAATNYSFPAPAHGGGYDDLAFTEESAFIVASAPANTGDHVPAIQKVTGLSGGTVSLATVLYDDSTVTDRATGKPVKLALSDPDSLWFTRSGELALTAQADAQTILIKDPGTEDQRASVINTTTAGAAEQLDDSAVATSPNAFLLVVDQTANMTYKLTRDGGFRKGTSYTQAPNDSKTPSIVGTLDTRTGVVTPIATGYGKPTGMIFVASGDGGDDNNPGGDNGNNDGGQGQNQDP